MFIFTRKNKAKHDQTPLDIYFSSLEEAYGNLPVPSDDWAGVKKLLADKLGSQDIAISKIRELEDATEVIRNHYIEMASILGKEQKYG